MVEAKLEAENIEHVEHVEHVEHDQSVAATTPPLSEAETKVKFTLVLCASRKFLFSLQ